MSFISISQKTIWLEIICLTGLFYLFGGWPVPDVNEQYYIGKAIHFWNRDWLPNDWFLDTPDSHWFFYGTFGFFSLFFSPITLTWFGRWIIWILTAWSWRRLSFALIPKPGFSILTASALLFLLDSFHLAGEWIIGGVEGKGFAFPFVFLGLESFFKNKSKICWIYWGIASAFHVLVGGWTVLVALAVWFIQELKYPKLLYRHSLAIMPALLIGGGISLLGLIPALLLDLGSSSETIRAAHLIYVFERLSHHLVPSSLPWTFLTRFALLVSIFVVIFFFQLLSSYIQKVHIFSNQKLFQCLGTTNQGKSQTPGFRFYAFIFVAIFIAALGLSIDFGIADRTVSAELLRFYWFRLSDWVVPFGIVFGCFSLLNRTFNLIVYCRPFVEENFSNAPSLTRTILFKSNETNLNEPGLKTTEKKEFSSKNNISNELDSNNFSSNYLELNPGLSNILKKNEKNQRCFKLNEFINSALIWLMSLTAIFMSFKYYYLTYSQEQAASISQGLSWSFLPKPVDGIAFLSTILFVLGVILIVYGIFAFCSFFQLKRWPFQSFSKKATKSALDININNQKSILLTNENLYSNVESTKTNKDSVSSDFVLPLFPESTQSTISSYVIREGQIGMVLLLTILVVFAPLYYSIGMLQTRTSTVIPRSNPPKESISEGWMDVCRWVHQKTDPNAVFLVPRSCESFKWNANRAEIGNWKEIPQDASSIVQWFQQMTLFYTVPGAPKETRWNQPLIVVLISKGLPEVQKECEKYQIGYIIAETPPYNLASHEKAMKRYQSFLDYKVYQNTQFIVFNLKKKSQTEKVKHQ
ncbi:MAG: hypothetical protein Q4C95_05250 [Planctomycetia bacterium]|nr:hypothetical protein [Planctomycetia bacterium]